MTPELIPDPDFSSSNRPAPASAPDFRRQEQIEALRGVAEGIARLLDAKEFERARRLEPLLLHLSR